jgi:putative ABC transport system permease protein
MFQYLFQKIINKKWMIISQLVGIILLIGIAASNPMYLNAALSRMLTDEFEKQAQTDQSWPFDLTAARQFEPGEGIDTYQNTDAFMLQAPDSLHVKAHDIIRYRQLSGKIASSLWGREEAGESTYNLASMSDLKDHIKIISGKMFSDQIKDGVIEVIISEAAMVKLDVLLNEELQFSKVTAPDGSPIVIKIVGTFKEADSSDMFFNDKPDDLLTQCFMAEPLFEQLFLSGKAQRYEMKSTWYDQMDDQNLNIHNVSYIIVKTYEIMGGDYKKYITDTSYTEVLTAFKSKLSRIRTTFWILQIPLLVLLCSFLFMISGQMLKMEQNEISVMKSRGASKLQIIALYFYQSSFLALLGLLLGIPLGRLFTTVLGSTNEFLEFSSFRSLNITMNIEVLIYALAAAVLTILVTIFPVLRYSNISIVNLKQQKYRNNKSLWERFFLDFILIAIALYCYFIYTRNSSQIVAGVSSGKGAEPLLYLGSSIFVLGLGMLYLRLHPYLIQLIYLIGRKFWKPATYTSFLQTMRMGRKQHFIMLFMIMMISLGIFDSVVARTIIVNAEKNVKYLDGADVSSLELWSNNGSGSAMASNTPFTYYEPDYDRYASIAGIKTTTKVMIDKDTYIKNDNDSLKGSLTLMGINTKEFGTMIPLSQGLNKENYYAQLNKLVSKTNNILVSYNFKNKLGYHIGDKLEVYNHKGNPYTGTICGFFQYWPTYVDSSYVVTSDGNSEKKDFYLIVGNLNSFQNSLGVTPYYIFMDFKENTQGYYNFVKQNDLNISDYTDMTYDLEDVRTDTLFQGTNGILTMSFIIILLLCIIGYLIYWILSIKSRELLFGVLRAMGMKKREIYQILINEQLFTGLIPIIVGSGIGYLAAVMFVPLLQTAYASSQQVLPLELVTKSSDMLRLFLVVLLVLAVCLTIIMRLVSKLNITNALKLGED